MIRRPYAPGLLLLLPPLVAALVIACGSGGPAPASFGPGDAGGGPAPGAGADAGSFPGNLLGDGGGALVDAAAAGDAFTLPSNFVPTELGGYALGPVVDGSGVDGGNVQNGSSQSCALVVGVVRDFLSYGRQDGGSPDFEQFTGSGPTTGLVQAALGTDQKPVYGAECDDTSVVKPPCTHGQQMTTQANFDQWYRLTEGVNLAYLVYLEFVPNGGVYTFSSKSYFPLDGAGFGNTPGLPHNFSFTTELHMRFVYRGGETFSFTGDDDLWVFIDGKRVIDLGGSHSSATATVALDSLGLTVGTEYPLDLFNAERHSMHSDFEVDTDLGFTNCGTVPPDVPK